MASSVFCLLSFVMCLVGVCIAIPMRNPDNWKSKEVAQQLPIGSSVTGNGISVDESLAPTTTVTSQATDAVKSRHRRDASLTITLLQDSTDNLQNRSVSPWTYSVQTDSNRQPADLVVATCTKTTVSGTANVCEHVYYYVPVKTKTTSNGVVTWTDSWVRIAAGCTLSNPPTQPANPPSGGGDPTLD